MSTNTLLTTIGRPHDLPDGAVNAPVSRTSTVLFPNTEACLTADLEGINPASYGRNGTSTTRMLESALATLEGADHSLVFSSGLSAIVCSLMAFSRAGDHVLLPESIYGSSRRFGAKELSRFGVEVEFYDPLIGGNITSILRPTTRVVYLESPGSMTLEVQDISVIVSAAKKHGCIVIADNTWATPLHFKPFEHGIDVSIHSATKYISGHSDIVMGVASTTREHFPALLRTFSNMGIGPGPDACALALRGLRTMKLRLDHQHNAALQMTEWLMGQPDVAQVIYPPHPKSIGHAEWKNYFTGGASVLTMLLQTNDRAALARMLDGMKLFKMGFSWGGYESLAIPFLPGKGRGHMPWSHDGWAVRLHIGIEDTSDLQADLAAGFARLKG